MFNPGNDYKRDIAIRASGYWVLKTASGDPKMQTLEEISKTLGANFKELWAHSITRGSRATRVAPVATDTVLWVPALSEPEDGSTFSETNLMQWMPSREENTSTGLECKGSLRVAFEVELAQDMLKPDNCPEAANCCCLFWKKV